MPDKGEPNKGKKGSNAKKLGILLFTGPESEDVNSVVGLAQAALKRGIKVEIFMMYEAVYNTVKESLKKVCEDGAEVTLCDHNARELNAARYEKFKYASQYEHSNIAGNSDRYIAFI